MEIHNFLSYISAAIGYIYIYTHVYEKDGLPSKKTQNTYA